MSLPTPTQFPDFCQNDQVDPVSNENNAIPPPQELVSFGWPRASYVVRNFLNYLFRWTGTWIRYLSQNDSKSQTVIVNSTAYGATTPQIAMPGRNSVCMLYIQDNTPGTPGPAHPGDYFVGIFCPSTGTTNRTVNIISNNDVTVGQYNGTTGTIVVSTSDTGTSFNLVCVQYMQGS
jgi:hypothetical protein